MRFCLFSIIFLTVSFLGFGEEATSVHPSSPKAVTKGKLPGQTLIRGRSMAFIENRGQFDSEVKFQARSGNKVLWFTRMGVVFDVLSPSIQGAVTPVTSQKGRDKRNTKGSQEVERLVFTEKFGSSSVEPKIEASGARPGTYNYFIGNDPAKWRTKVVSYSELLYREVWPGVNVRFVANGSDIEQEFLVSAGADSSSIHVEYCGVDGLEVPPDGSMVVRTKFGPMRESSPRIYQEKDGYRTSIQGKYLISGLAYKFEVESYNNHQPLVIDPTLLFSTYIGSGGIDIGEGIAVDGAGNTFIAGSTQGPSGTPYPTTPGVFQSTPPNVTSAVVSKFDALGNLAYSTYLGSPYGSNAKSVAVDSSGEAYVTGVGNASFPTTSNAFQQGCGSSSFMSKLNSTGTALVYSTCLGAEGYAGVGANAIAVDSNGRAYLTGSTSDSNFPVTANAFQSSLTDPTSAYLSIIDPSLSGSASLVYSTHLGGELQDFGQAIAIDSFGSAYITGYTSSAHFPVTATAFQPTDLQNVCNNGGGQSRCFTGFVAKLNPAAAGAAGLIFSSYLGGNVGSANGYGAGDYPSSIAVDLLGNSYIGGTTDSLNFPATSGAFETSSACTGSGFVTKVNAGGSKLIYSTFLHPNNVSSGNCSTAISGLTLDRFGNAYVTGYTRSPSFPVTPNAFQSTIKSGGAAGTDAVLTELDSIGSSLVYSTFLGGRGDDAASAVAVDYVGDVYLTGNTSSYDFPVTPFAFQPRLATDPSCLRPGVFCQDIFVTKFPLGAPGGLAITGIEPNFGGNAGAVSPEILGSGFHSGATAKLSCSGQSDILGTGSTINGQGQLLTATFDLTTARPGGCNLVVTNPDGSSAKLAQSFTVQQGGAPKIQLSMVGAAVRQGVPEIANVPTNAILVATVANIGNVDSSGGVLSLPLTSLFAGTSADPLDLVPQGSPLEIWAGAHFPAQSAQNLVATATTVAPFEFSKSGTAASIAGPGSIQTITASATITAVTCQTWGAKIKACYYPSPDIHPFALDACIVNSSAFQDCGHSTLGCAARCSVGGPDFLRCLGACLVASGVACARPVWSAVDSCLESTSSPGAAICTDGPIRCLGPSDPNSLTGPSGAGPLRWISSAQQLTYLITFENKPDATAPAQKVIVTQPLSATVDLDKLGLLTITVPSGTSAIPVNIPAGAFDPRVGLNEFVTNVDLRPMQNMLVNVDAKLDTVARTLLWTFTTIDPSTGQPPLNPLVGFLPASGNGSVSFTATPNSTLATGTQIIDQATILFIGSSPMNTPAWANTIDDTPPTSYIHLLPATESSPSFNVTWVGTDVGSGIQSYSIFASDNGSPFTAWQTNTTSTTATYSGISGHNYSFYSIATDLVGNIEAPKTAAEATTTVQASSGCATDVSSQVTLTRGGFRYDHAIKSFVQTLSLTNNGASLTDASLVIDSLSADATLTGAGGKTACAAPLGSPWVSVPGTLAAGQTLSLTLTFSDPTQGGILYSTRILAGNGQQ